MKKIVIIGIAVIVLVIGGFLILRSRTGSSAQAVLKVASTPGATVFLNNENIGKTPYEDKVKPGEYTLKLIPESTVDNITSWEGKITLNPSLLTFVNRELKESELTSAGEILTLEKISGSTAQISVISTPDGATVTIDGSEKGTTPIVIRDLDAGNYELSVSAIGATPRSMKIKTTAGYQLNAVFNLASTGLPVASAAPSPSPTEEEDATPRPRARVSPGASPRTSPRVSPRATPGGSPKASSSAKASPPAKPYVEISDTPTGFLRVRAEASSSAEEVGRVNPGEFYALLDEDNGWYKIEYEANKEGWVSGQYAKKTE